MARMYNIMQPENDSGASNTDARKDSVKIPNTGFTGMKSQDRVMEVLLFESIQVELSLMPRSPDRYKAAAMSRSWAIKRRMCCCVVNVVPLKATS
tara:strand:- start:48 stop:332 length:285 start_codon:yes stop_codon:yes gene_type:complete